MCYLCGEPFNRPRVLDCGDSFCHECLDKILKENRGSALKCPQCYHPLDSKRTYPINTNLQKNVELSATYLQLIFNIYNEQLILRCTSIADFFSKSFRSRFPFFQVKFPKKRVNSDHRGSPHRVLSIEAAKKRREQVGISLEAYSRSVKETSETLSKMSAYIQTFISNDLQRAEDICYIYQQSSIYERELKKKREVLDEALEEQRILVARFHREAKKELDEKFTAVEDALRKVGDQN